MATYYIATTGNDSTGTGAIGNPWQTFNKAFSVMNAGDTLFVRGGTYSGINSNNTIIPNGTSSAYTTISRYLSETVTLGLCNIAAPSDQGQNEIKYVTFDGFRINGASGGDSAFVLWTNVHHVRLQNLEVFGATTNHSGIILQSV